MERRKFLIGVGSTAVGTSALVGSGAFTSVEAERAATVETAPDSAAYLRLAEHPNSPNAAYANEDGMGRIELDLSASNADVAGHGVNPDAVTQIDDVFVVENQGTQAVDVSFTGTGDHVDFQFDGSNITVGEQRSVSLSIDSTGLGDGESLIPDNTVTVSADPTG